MSQPSIDVVTSCDAGWGSFARPFISAARAGVGVAHIAPPDRAGEDGAVQQDEGVRRAPRGFSTVEHYPLRYPQGRRRTEVAEIRHLSAETYCWSISFLMFCGAAKTAPASTTT